MVTERDNSGRFVKGHASNGGRPKGLAEQARAATREGADLVTFYAQAFRGYMDTVYRDEEGVEKVVNLPIKPELRMEAAEWLADRGWGKAVQTIQGDVTTLVKVYQGFDLDKV